MINIKMNPPTPPSMPELAPKILVIGTGGAGGNCLKNMEDLECTRIAMNTDAQALAHCDVDVKVQLGEHVTGGLGAGSKPEVGKAAAEESFDEIISHLEGANMAFVTAGMGGGTGTGAAPIIAKACRDMGILTVGVVTKPFHFEGSHRMKLAEEGIREMQQYVDTLIVIPNQNLFRVASEKTTFSEAFVMSDSVLQSGVRGVTDLIMKPGLVNLDFADIRTAMMEMGKAMMGTGEAEGEKRAIEAAESAINNPLLDDVSMKGARGLIINVTGGYDMTLFEADEAANRIREEVDPDANIIFGATFDENMNGKMRVSIVATGIDKAEAKKNGIGGSDGKLLRAKPQTITAPAAPTKTTVTAPAATQTTKPAMPQTVSKPLTAPVQTVAKDEPEADLFEQQQFTHFPPSDMKINVPHNTVLRGSRYKDAFIPPQPVAPQYGTTPAGFNGYQAPQTQTTPAPQTHSFGQQPAPQEQQSTGLVLNPPKLPTPQERKKTPSFLERLSGTVQQGIDGVRERFDRDHDGQDHYQQQHQTPPSFEYVDNGQGQGGQGQGQQHNPPSQGRLNIDTPAAKKDTQNDFDIPAFLRRQAN